MPAAQLRRTHQVLLLLLGESQNIPIMVVGNKCDEESLREVSNDAAQEAIKTVFKNCGFIETSAKTNHNVKEAFQVRI